APYFSPNHRFARARHACPVQFPAFAGLSLRRQGDMPTSWGIAPILSMLLPFLSAPNNGIISISGRQELNKLLGLKLDLPMMVDKIIREV
ncbi:TPA: hypothetical protein DD712_01005, partial [Candidatus Acetothermia bacterium]|nr:hypothetical protein [Candidatus Acetothermia bacterium]